VLLDEVLTALSPRDGGVYADGTVGGAGHAAAILAASSPTGWLYGCDRDGLALEAAGERLKPYEGRHELRRGNFAELCGWVPAGACDGVLLDLGVSSPQLDVAERGFSFQQDGPLDMRMDQRQEMTAAELLNTWDAEDLASVFWRYGDERDSRRVARAIVHDREAVPFKRTRQLAELLERLLPKRGRAHPGTKVFQALRIAVNDEMGSLERGLAGVVGLLKPGGRLAVITFHSLEDRTVKHFGRSRTRDYDFDGPVDIPELRRPKVPELRWVSRKATCPGDLELAENPRSRSAQLRVFEKA
jgi:16S rRNA (cytosine1402-N4)-methyltransferase